MGNDNWPEVGEFVVCTVKNVTDFGAYVELENSEGGKVLSTSPKLKQAGSNTSGITSGKGRRLSARF
jgi:polyribonucleotide nucleotidyltransferase